MDINALLGQLTGTAQQRKSQYVQQAELMNAETARMADLMTVNLDRASEVANESARIAGMEAEASARQQEALVKASVTLGLDPDNVENELITSMGEYDFAEAERKRVRQEFSRLSQISLLDNPLQYLAAQLQLPQVAARNNELVDMRDAAARNIQTRQALLAQHKSAVVVNTADTIREIGLAKAENARRAAEIQLEEARIQNASKIAGQRLQIFQHTDKLYDIDSDLINKKLQIGQYMMSMEERREARAERAAQAAERLELSRSRQKVQREEDEGIAEFSLQLQRLSQFLGLKNPITYEVWRRIPDKKRQQAIFDAATTGSMGSGLLESLSFFEAMGGMNTALASNQGVASSASGMKQGVLSYTSLVREELRKTGQKAKEEEIVQAAATNYTDAIIASARDPKSGHSLTSNRWDQVFNPYRAQHKVLVDEMATLPEHPLTDNRFAAVISERVAQAADKTAPNLSAEDEQRALRVMAELVKRREITLGEASRSIADYYAYATTKNRDLFQYDLFNLPPQTSYFGQIDKIGMFGSPVAVNLVDPTHVKKQLAAAIRGSAPSLSVGTMIPAFTGAEMTLGAASIFADKFNQQPAED
jgi:hypothetical protein